MANVLLISETKLKSFTNINKNVDMDVLKAEIKIAQDIEIQTVLGTKFYNTLLSRGKSTGNTFTVVMRKHLSMTYIAPYPYSNGISLSNSSYYTTEQ
jgi:hypothetical protein